MVMGMKVDADKVEDVLTVVLDVARKIISCMIVLLKIRICSQPQLLPCSQ